PAICAGNTVSVRCLARNHPPRTTFGEIAMGLGTELKEFAMKGNVIDLAVGVVIGAAFGKIVSSVVSDVIMPPLGLAIGGVDFKEYGVNLATGADGKAVLPK